MTVFRITPDNSKHAGEYAAFSEYSKGTDSLIVEAGAYLSASGLSASAARLNHNSSWDVTIDGRLSSTKYDGLHIEEGNQNVTEITIGETGTISGGTAGIYTLSNVILTNHGTIEGETRAGIEVTGSGRNLIINLGEISGDSYAFRDLDGTTDDTIRNSGTMTGSVGLGKGNDRLLNSGVIEGGASASIGLGAGDDVMTNSGQIAIAITDTLGNDRLTNSGTISNTVDLGTGDDVFTNFVRAKGRTTDGTVTGEIRLGDGDDTLVGGKRVEDYRDGGGSDVADLGAGNDVYRATTVSGIDGRDRIDGGKGIDTYDATLASSVYINLDSARHKLGPITGLTEIGAGTALGSDIAGTRSDRLSGFENVFTGGGGDVVFGSSGGNYISSAGGIDILHGMGGDDYLIGGDDMDFLYGGRGHDLLDGGAGGDMFVFESVKDSVTKSSRRDVILDFQDGLDAIDLSAIDAVKGGRDSDFTFIGMDVTFSGEAGELRTIRSGNGHVIQGDIDGDKKADFSIGVADLSGSIVFGAEDFSL